MDNMKIWDAVKAVPADSRKQITGGRLSGMTDIKPQWRLQTLTEQFGPCGVGWYYQTVEHWTEHEIVNNTVSTHIIINLFVNIGGEWSKPIEGEGSSMIIAKEKSGLYHSDEATKMARTDALSVACKQLGIGADVYMGWPNGRPSEDYPEEADKLRACTDIDELIAVWPSVHSALDKTGREAIMPVYAEMKAKLS